MRLKKKSLELLLTKQNDQFEEYLKRVEVDAIKKVPDQSKVVWKTEAAITKVIKEFQGICTTIIFDRKIDDSELRLLYEWRNYRKNYLIRFPLIEFDKLMHGGVTEPDQDKFLTKLYNFIEPLALHLKQSPIQGIYDYPENILFERMVFTLTGNFRYGEKIEIANLIDNRFGIVADNIRKDTNYLIVGCKGNENYTYGSFGRKVEEAINRRSDGTPIMILEETHFLEVYNKSFG